MDIEWRRENPSDLLLAERPPADRHPAEAYLANRRPRLREATREALDAIGSLMTGGRGTALTLAWHLLRDEDVANLHQALMERYTAAVATRMLAALRGVLKECWRLGLMASEDYRRIRDTAVPPADDGSPGRVSSRGELRSVFESCGDEGPAAAGRGSAPPVRALLYGNGHETGREVKQLSPPHAPAPAVRGNAIRMEQLSLRRVAPREAIAHALWEADVCLRQWAFCACLVMLRKALDLWSAGYRDWHGLTFNRGAGERDDLYWRLRKIAEENKLHRATITAIIDSLRDDTHDGTAGSIVCHGGHVTSYNGLAAARTKESYRRLHEMVIHLITTTTPDLPI